MLKDIFNSQELSIHKWSNYFEIYEFYLDKYVNKSPKMIDISKVNKVSKFKLVAARIIGFINKVLGYLRIRPLYIGSTSQRL